VHSFLGRKRGDLKGAPEDDTYYFCCPLWRLLRGTYSNLPSSSGKILCSQHCWLLESGIYLEDPVTHKFIGQTYKNVCQQFNNQDGMILKAKAGHYKSGGKSENFQLKIIPIEL